MEGYGALLYLLLLCLNVDFSLDTGDASELLPSKNERVTVLGGWCSMRSTPNTSSPLSTPFLKAFLKTELQNCGG